jgi:hypothetical protein
MRQYMKRPDKFVKDDAILSARPDSEKQISKYARLHLSYLKHHADGDWMCLKHPLQVKG